MNIGINGIITNKNSIAIINKIHKLGDILQFSVKKYDNIKKCFVLDFIKKENSSVSNNNNINYYTSKQQSFNNNTNIAYLQNNACFNNYSPSITPKNYNFYNGYKFMIPIPYSPVNYLMNDSIYVNSYSYENVMNVMLHNSNINVSNNINSNTKLNINNSTKFKLPSKLINHKCKFHF